MQHRPYLIHTLLPIALWVTHSACGGVLITDGTEPSPTPSGCLTIDPPGLFFSEQHLDGAAVETKRVRVENRCDGLFDTGPLTITSTALEGAAQFVLEPDAPHIIKPFAADTLEVSFKPTAPQLFEGVLTMTTDDPNHPIIHLPVLGRGVAPILNVEADSFLFDTHQVGETLSRQVRLTNRGNTDLEITNIRFATSSVNHFDWSDAEFETPVFIEPSTPDFEDDDLSFEIHYTSLDATDDMLYMVIESNDPFNRFTSVAFRGEVSFP